jgi:tetratricopeptide (TPR) repeat protein
MSKISNDYIFTLIKSLTRHEKRYFKVFANRHILEEEDNSYIKLYDIIDALDVYDEEAMIRDHAHETFMKRFAVSKSRLYDMILKSLHSYHSSSSVDAELKKMLHIAEILFKKTLYRQCDRILKKAKKLAEDHNKHTTMLEITLWEKRIVEKDNYSGQDDETIKEILRQDLKTIDLIQNYYTLWNLKSRFFLPLYKGGKARSLEEKERFNKILKHPLLQSEDMAISVEAKYLYHHIFSAHYFSIGDYEKSYRHMIRNLKIIEDNYILFKEEPNTYFSILANVIYIGNQLEHHQDVRGYFKKLKKFTAGLDMSDNRDLEMRIFNSMKSLELTIHVQKGEYNEALEMLPDINEGLERFSGKLSPLRKADFFFNIAITFFGLEQYSDSLKYINRIINESKIDENEDLFSFSKLLGIVIHFELGHYELVAYQAESTYRYLRKRNRVYKSENALIKFFKKVQNSPELSHNMLRELRAELIELSQEPLERPSLEYFDFISWIDSKLDKLPFAQVVRQRHDQSFDKSA